jgi:deoxyribodipyrimidine photo-lyase
LRAQGSDVVLLRGVPEHALVAFARRFGARAIYFNEDYEPNATARDERVERALREANVDVHRHVDHVCLTAEDVRTNNGHPYRVFTPYARNWRERYAVAPVLPLPTRRAIEGRLATREAIGDTSEVPLPEDFGFRSSQAYPQCGEVLAARMLDEFLCEGGNVERYAMLRDVPFCDVTSHLSVQLRAGTIGIRTCFYRAYRAARDPNRRAGAEKWISELIWREYFQMVLREFPRVATEAFIDGGNRITWANDEGLFTAWCDGRTGFPIVDAAMRQLNESGWMHNRLRMIVASFLTKDLLIDWRWGERYFETHLADADLAQNNGGWQWAASTGVDAAPYFRIFNPVLQSKKFDPDGAFIRKMIPELRHVTGDAVHAPWREPLLGLDYPSPVVDHEEARLRALNAYSVIGSAAGTRGRSRV